ncbi:MAG TPA: hypothetical protein VMH89_06220, partial [Candidatus Acidoferrum sp.]|nr:hypothetical protein [Candidatus Acidoferrum sp.]
MCRTRKVKQYGRCATCREERCIECGGELTVFVRTLQAAGGPLKPSFGLGGVVWRISTGSSFRQPLLACFQDAGLTSADESQLLGCWVGSDDVAVAPDGRLFTWGADEVGGGWLTLYLRARTA